MALPAGFLEELRARTPLPALVGRSVRLLRAGREHKGCCPFHGEKTPSFYVNDERFHCFGCGEHGDAISFVMKQQSLGFMEAVRSLAAEAGLEVPQASPAEAEKEARRAGVREVLAAAAQIYQAWLFEPGGAAALAYLRGRGLSEAVIRRFGLGWSGEGRGALAAACRRLNIAPAQLIEAGLMKQGEFSAVDMFFSRVMFPIRDGRGAVLSFSGRVLGDGVPKYVNGPETAIFAKRRSVYGVDLAREPARKGGTVIIVEGQMDVISLAVAGFSAVAPLGTALTEEQLAEIWRLSPLPVLCFDADNAGRRAALRVAELALSRLGADRSLKFMRLPEKQDPDSLIRGQGAAGFAAQLAAARPLAEALYDMLAEGAERATPEGRAAFRGRLLEAASRIGDRVLAGEYRASLLDRFFAERRAGGGLSRRAGSAAGGRAMQPAAALRPVRPVFDPAAADAGRGRILTAILLAHPALLAAVEEAYALIDLPADCASLRQAFSDLHDRHAGLDSAALRAYLAELGFAGETAQLAASLPACAGPEASLAEAGEGWWHFFGLMRASLERLREQRDEQQRRHLREPDDPQAWRKLVRLNAALKKAEEGETGAAG